MLSNNLIKFVDYRRNTKNIKKCKQNHVQHLFDRHQVDLYKKKTLKIPNSNFQSNLNLFLMEILSHFILLGC